MYSCGIPQEERRSRTSWPKYCAENREKQLVKEARFLTKGGKETFQPVTLPVLTILKAVQDQSLLSHQYLLIKRMLSESWTQR